MGGEAARVTLMLIFSAALCAVALYGIARVSRAAMYRLGLDPMATLLWLGLAEWPAETPPGYRQRR